MTQWPRPGRLALANGYHLRQCLCRQLSDLRRGQVSSWPSRQQLVLRLPMSQLSSLQLASAEPNAVYLVEKPYRVSFDSQAVRRHRQASTH